MKGYHVEFPVMAKVEVNGHGAVPAYNYLRKYSELKGEEITWNFAKFLVNGEGDVVAYYPPETSPNSIKPDIEKLLNTKN